MATLNSQVRSSVSPDRVGDVYWDGPLELMEPTADSRALPSLLGRDVLDNFRLTVSRRESLISLEIPLRASRA